MMAEFGNPENRREILPQEALVRPSGLNEPNTPAFETEHPEPAALKEGKKTGDGPVSSSVSVEASPTALDRRIQDVARVAPLFLDSEVEDLRSRWSNVQAGFVDQPRHSVEQLNN